MRKLITISLPQELSRAVEENVKTGHYASKSEFFRHLLRTWTEGKLTRELAESRKELTRGHGKKLHSLKDLR